MIKQGSCLRGHACGGGNGLCEADESTCRCLAGYFAINGLCVRGYYEEYACSDWDKFKCSGGNGECSKFGSLCECRPGFFANHDQCVGTSYAPITGNCSAMQPCVHGVCYTEADGERCRCNAGYMAVSKQCGRMDFTLTEGCLHDSDCGDNARCLTHIAFGTCVCRPGFLLNGLLCVSPSFPDVSCKIKGQVCGGGNGACLHGVCHCDAGFFSSGVRRACIPMVEVLFSQEYCWAKSQSCYNGVCRSPGADQKYKCMCHPGFIPYPYHTEGIKQCVSQKNNTGVQLIEAAAESSACRPTQSAWFSRILTVLGLVFNFFGGCFAH
nr:hypothetical protein BaRGS_020277 [Batillaria attramentaria]